MKIPRRSCKKMSKLSLAGAWKLRGEFMDVTAERYNEVLRKMDAAPVRATLPAFLKLEDLSEEERAEFFKEPNPHFHVMTDKSNHAFPSKYGFIPMTVPGDVTTALIENGIVEEPFLKENTKKNQWIKDLSWWLVRDFDVTEEMLNEDIVRLNIEMLDFNADIIVNGMPAAHHENAFCAFSEDIKRFLHVGKNQLVIRLTSGMELHYPRDAVSFYCASENAICDQRVYTRKPQFTYGWDWCQPVPTCGIGRSIEIEAFSGAQVIASRVDTLKLDGDDAEVEFHFEIEKSDMVSSAECELTYTLEFEGKTVYTGKKTLVLGGGVNFAEERVTIKNAKLWWPNGYGAQNLYTFKACCVTKGILHEMQPKKIGIRTLELDTSKLEDGSRNFFFKVNGVRIFCKGGNWVPTDSLYLRTPKESYETLVREGAAAHFTMFRMWGGGTYEPDCFYEYCSEYGILLMHDFMYACAFYPDHKNDFLFEAEREAEYQTKRLAHYPCMAIWTGNNEIAESYTDWFPARTFSRTRRCVSSSLITRRTPSGLSTPWSSAAVRISPTSRRPSSSPSWRRVPFPRAFVVWWRSRATAPTRANRATYTHGRSSAVTRKRSSSSSMSLRHSTASRRASPANTASSAHRWKAPFAVTSTAPKCALITPSGSTTASLTASAATSTARLTAI